MTAAQDAATVLAGLSSARTPWLTLALAGPADHDRFTAAAAAAGDVTVVDITDPQAVPVMVNPFGPAGLFLEGGHPVGLARLLRGNVLVTGGGLADEDARPFLAGVLLLRLAGQLSPRTARRSQASSQARAICRAWGSRPSRPGRGSLRGKPRGSAVSSRTCDEPGRTSW